MSGSAPSTFVKGAACQCIDVLHENPAVLQRFRMALVDLAAKDFVGLETVFGQLLLPLKCNPAKVNEVVQHLKEFWFDPNSPTAYFPTTPPEPSIAHIYGIGLIQTLSLSIGNGAAPPLPIDSYWLVDHQKFQMLNFATPRQVTLIIATPRPRDQIVAAARAPAVGTGAWSTELRDGKVHTRKIEPPSL